MGSDYEVVPAGSEYEVEPVSGAARVAGHPLTRFAVGAAAPYFALSQLQQKILPTRVGQANLESYRQYQELAKQGHEGADVAGTLGQILNPVNLAMGKALPAAVTLGQKVKQGMQLGGAAAAMTPTEEQDYWKNKAIQTALGIGFGAAVPLGIEGVKKTAGAVKRVGQPMVDLFTKSGPYNIAKRGYERIVGEPNIPAVSARLQQARPLVPGSQPTAAEAVAGVPEGSPIQALQRVTARTPGGPSAQFGKRLAEQQAARQQALESIAAGQTPEAAEAARSAAAKVNYAAAGKEVVKADNALRDLLKRPAMQKAEAHAMQLARESGEPFATTKGFYPVRKLHFMKLALDDMIKTPERFALGKSEEAAIAKTKEQFTKWIAQHSQLYEKARATHAALSEPLNRAQVREALQSKLMSPTGQETPGSFVKAVDEAAQMLKKATGNPRYTKIEQVLQPQEAQTARNVAADLERSFLAQRPLQRTDLPTMGNITNEAMPKLSLLSRPVVIANALLSHLGKTSVEPKVDAINAYMLLHPEKLGQFLQPTPPLPSRYQVMMEELMKQAPQAAGVLAGRTR